MIWAGLQGDWLLGAPGQVITEAPVKPVGFVSMPSSDPMDELGRREGNILIRHYLQMLFENQALGTCNLDEI